MQSCTLSRRHSATFFAVSYFHTLLWKCTVVILPRFHGLSVPFWLCHLGLFLCCCSLFSVPVVARHGYRFLPNWQIREHYRIIAWCVLHGRYFFYRICCLMHRAIFDNVICTPSLYRSCCWGTQWDALRWRFGHCPRLLCQTTFVTPFCAFSFGLLPPSWPTKMRMQPKNARDVPHITAVARLPSITLDCFVLWQLST